MSLVQQLLSEQSEFVAFFKQQKEYKFSKSI